MIAVLLAGVMALGAVQQQTDTTFAVRPGGQLELHAFGGRANVRTWDRNQIRVQARHDAAIRVSIRQRGSTTFIEPERRGGLPATGVRLDIFVPRSFDVRLEGLNLSADVEALRGRLHIENMEGSLNLRDITGDVTVESVSGPLRMEGIRGSVNVTAVNQSVHLTRVQGGITVETVNGSVILRDVDSDRASISTVNGFIDYDGRIHDGGRYFLGTHNGRITLSVPEQANARISVSAASGKVESAFPVSLGSMNRDSYAITVGTGSARIELESFNGNIQLVRPGGR
jgi:hypothetical protein